MNRRKFTRKVYLGDVKIWTVPHGKWFDASAINISQGGLELYCNYFLEPNHLVKLIIQAEKTRAKTLYGRVTNVRVEIEGNVLGIAFACPLSAEDKQTLFRELGVKISL